MFTIKKCLVSKHFGVLIGETLDNNVRDSRKIENYSNIALTP